MTYIPNAHLHAIALLLWDIVLLLLLLLAVLLLSLLLLCSLQADVGSATTSHRFLSMST